MGFFTKAIPSFFGRVGNNLAVLGKVIGSGAELLGKGVVQAGKAIAPGFSKDGVITNFVQDHLPGGGLVTAAVHMAAGNRAYAEYAAVKGTSSAVAFATKTALGGPAGAILAGGLGAVAGHLTEGAFKALMKPTVKDLRSASVGSVAFTFGKSVTFGKASAIAAPQKAVVQQAMKAAVRNNPLRVGAAIAVTVAAGVGVHQLKKSPEPPPAALIKATPALLVKPAPAPVKEVAPVPVVTTPPRVEPAPSQQPLAKPAPVSPRPPVQAPAQAQRQVAPRTQQPLAPVLPQPSFENRPQVISPQLPQPTQQPQYQPPTLPQPSPQYQQQAAPPTLPQPTQQPQYQSPPLPQPSPQYRQPSPPLPQPSQQPYYQSPPLPQPSPQYRQPGPPLPQPSQQPYYAPPPLPKPAPQYRSAPTLPQPTQY